ncbi:MAG: ribbon-helix-helix protein, CopG family [Nocardioidaceae bacterium]|nr:ribbon-helix-helix protein, CopG family [Nocardioidaceae bacterium]
MRTTVNIDADLLAEAKQVAARTHRSRGCILEDALRLMIASNERRMRRTSRLSCRCMVAGVPDPE